MCDTFGALPSVTVDGSVVFGKNSDREPNEAQALEYHAARVYSPPTTLQCTYRAIPQVKATLGILISRLFWMWGAEMGANEKGVVIGNEDFAAHLRTLSFERDQIEKAWIEKAAGISAPRQWDLTQAAFRQARQKTSEWLKQIRPLSEHRHNRWIYQRYWEKLNRKVGIIL